MGSSWASTPGQRWKMRPELGANEMISPRILSSGNDSNNSTEWPFLWHSIAAVSPANPAPTMMTRIPVACGRSYGAMMIGILLYCMEVKLLGNLWHIWRVFQHHSQYLEDLSFDASDRNDKFGEVQPVRTHIETGRKSSGVQLYPSPPHRYCTERVYSLLIGLLSIHEYRVVVCSDCVLLSWFKWQLLNGLWSSQGLLYWQTIVEHEERQHGIYHRPKNTAILFHERDANIKVMFTIINLSQDLLAGGRRAVLLPHEPLIPCLS